jgi:hypothetical protein
MPNPRSPKHRRWLSFGLRSLFGFVTVVAIFFAWVSYERRQSSYEVQIALKLEERATLEITGIFDPRVPDFPWVDDELPTGWRKIMSDLCGPRIRSVSFGHMESSFSDLSLLTGLKSIDSLDLGFSEVKDLAPIVEHKKLKSLELQEILATDIAPLAALDQLEYLDLSGMRVADLTPLAGLKNLRVLILENTDVSDLSPISGLKKLAILHVLGTKVTDLSPLAGLTALESLHVDNTLVNDLTPLAGLNNLVYLNIEETPVDDLTPLLRLASLRHVDAQGAHVRDDQVELIKHVLPGRFEFTRPAMRFFAP